jgi:undecaprenyl-diphosphatase
MIEDLVRAAILGAVQGLTEFLPVSSTGHLILAARVLGIDEDEYGLPFDAALHLGTLLALLTFFGSTWLRLGRAGARSLAVRALSDPDARLAWLIVAGTVPAVVIGLSFERPIEDHLRSPLLVGIMLISFSAVFVLAERSGRQRRGMADAGLFDALFVGLAQAVALVPGVSRSGATISAGLFRDLERREAATFAFLLSAPVIAGAGSLQLLRVIGRFADGTYTGEDLAFFATGFVTAAVVGYAAIAFLMRYLSRNSLMAFVWYRVALGLVVIAAIATGV